MWTFKPSEKPRDLFKPLIFYPSNGVKWWYLDLKFFWGISEIIPAKILGDFLEHQSVIPGFAVIVLLMSLMLL